MLENLLTKGSRINMGINLSGADRLMTKHRLDGTKISTTFQKGSGKRMTEGMGRDRFLNASLARVLFYHNKYHRTGEMAAATVQKNIVFFTGFDGHVTTVIKPQVQFLDGLRGNRYQPLLAPFTKDTDKTFVEIKVAQREVY